MPSDVVAKKVLNVLCRAKDPGLPSIPPNHPLPAETTLTPVVATRTLDIISRLAKAASPECPPAHEAPDETLTVVKRLSGELPSIPPNVPLQGFVPSDLTEAAKLVRELSEQVKASVQTK